MPGETLQQGQSRFQRYSVDRDSPPNEVQDQSSHAAILDAIKGVKDGVESQMSALSDKLDTVYDKLSVLESRQKTLEDDLCASSSSPRTPIPGKRIRRTPPALQVAMLLCLTLYMCYMYLCLYPSEQN